MSVVEAVAKIRRAFFVRQKPIKQICRELRISRKVVRKVIRSDATAFAYARTELLLVRSMRGDFSWASAAPGA